MADRESEEVGEGLVPLAPVTPVAQVISITPVTPVTPVTHEAAYLGARHPFEPQRLTADRPRHVERRDRGLPAGAAYDTGSVRPA